MSASTLEGVPGLGPARRTRLLREFGSLRALREASYEELESLGWLPERVVVSVYEHLHPMAGSGAAGGRSGRPDRGDEGPDRGSGTRETARALPGEDRAR